MVLIFSLESKFYISFIRLEALQYYIDFLNLQRKIEKIFNLIYFMI